jgi:nitrous oxidase accessory protein
MFSDDNLFEDNLFERGAAGAALMYSRRLVFRRNRFLHNRGFASVGLLLQVCDDVLAEDNLIADNARGVFMEGVHRNNFRHNVIAEADTALVLYDSVRETRFEGNIFIGNLSPLELIGRRTDTVVDRNYWADSRGTDLDGDGIRDRPYRLSSVFDHFRGNLTAADLFAQGLGAKMLSAAEETFPILDPVPVLDAHPLARPPVLAHVPSAPQPARADSRLGLLASAGGLTAGLTVLAAGLRTSRRRS